MPRYNSSDVAHSAATDHRILRFPQPPDPKKPKAPRVADDGLVSFFDQERQQVDAEFQRAAAIARVRMSFRSRANIAPATSALQDAWNRDRNDLEAGDALAIALWSTDRQAEGMAVVADILARHPRRETSLLAAAQISDTLNRPAEAIQYWRHLVQVNPYHGQYRSRLVKQLMDNNGDWKEAEAACRAWVDLEPWSVEARRSWAQCQTQLGNHDAALEQEHLIKRLELSEPK